MNTTSEKPSKKPFYKRTWFIILIAIIILVGVKPKNDADNQKEQDSIKQTEAISEKQQNKQTQQKGTTEDKKALMSKDDLVKNTLTPLMKRYDELSKEGTTFLNSFESSTLDQFYRNALYLQQKFIKLNLDIAQIDTSSYDLNPEELKKLNAFQNALYGLGEDWHDALDIIMKATKDKDFSNLSDLNVWGERIQSKLITSTSLYLSLGGTAEMLKS